MPFTLRARKEGRIAGIGPHHRARRPAADHHLGLPLTQTDSWRERLGRTLDLLLESVEELAAERGDDPDEFAQPSKRWGLPTTT
jgi:hypothetical protein